MSPSDLTRIVLHQEIGTKMLNSQLFAILRDPTLMGEWTPKGKIKVRFERE